MQGTELNPNFFSDIVAAVSKELGAVLLCNIGGRIDVTDTNPAGTQSRSHHFPAHHRHACFEVFLVSSSTS